MQIIRKLLDRPPRRIRRAETAAFRPDPGGGWPPATLPVLRLLEPRMPPGAVLVVDNVRTFRADLAPVVEHVRAGGWAPSVLPLKEGTLVAARL